MIFEGRRLEVEVILSMIGVQKVLTVAALSARLRVGRREVEAAWSRRSRFDEEEVDVRIIVKSHEMVCPVIKKCRVAATNLMFQMENIKLGRRDHLWSRLLPYRSSM